MAKKKNNNAALAVAGVGIIAAAAGGYYLWDKYKKEPGAGWSLTTAVSPAGAGTVTVAPVKTKYTDKEKVTITAKANTGYVFSRWTKAGASYGTTASISATMTSDLALVAEFTGTGGGGDPTFTVTVNIKPDNTAGSYTVTHAGPYNVNELATFTASPASGHRFVNWTDANGTELTKSAVYTLNVTRSVILNANFRGSPYLEIISAPISQGGTVMFSCAGFDSGSVTVEIGQSGVKTNITADGAGFGSGSLIASNAPGVWVLRAYQGSLTATREFTIPGGSGGGQPTLTLSPTSIVDGSKITCTYTGFKANTDIGFRIYATSTPGEGDDLETVLYFTNGTSGSIDFIPTVGPGSYYMAVLATDRQTPLKPFTIVSSGGGGGGGGMQPGDTQITQVLPAPTYVDGWGGYASIVFWIKNNANYPIKVWPACHIWETGGYIRINDSTGKDTKDSITIAAGATVAVGGTYIVPEVFQGFFTLECEVWGLGISDYYIDSNASAYVTIRG
jgi:hypothetical protein